MDLIEWLEDADIAFWTEGKNISKGWTGIQCPFCDDGSNHCGISPDHVKFSCWKCGETGALAKLIRELTDSGWRSAYRIAEQIGQDALGIGFKESSLPTTDSIPDRPVQSILPPSSSDFPRIHRRYLRSRSFQLRQIKMDYDIRAVYTTGRYRFRIIIPYYLDGQLVNWVARDVTDRAKEKYLACSNSRAVVPLKSTFYNIDRAKDKIVLVEGVTDVWRIGKGSVASSGTIVTDEQLLLLTERRVKKVFIVFDEDATDKANRYANKLSSVLDVEIIELKGGDPADQDLETVSLIRGLLR